MRRIRFWIVWDLRGCFAACDRNGAGCAGAGRQAAQFLLRRGNFYFCWIFFAVGFGRVMGDLSVN